MLINLWNDFITSVGSKSESEPIIKSILSQLMPVELTEEKVVLACGSEGFKFFALKKIPVIERRLEDFFKKKVKVEITVSPKKSSRQNTPLLQFQPTIDDIFKKARLNSKYSFDNFAVSSTNQVAYAAAQSVAENLGRSYNPLFLHGGVGVGKTHIAQSVARAVLEKDPSKKVLFCPGDQFINDLVEAIREKSTPRFRKKYRQLDLLIVDDVQFIAGKNTLQEEFFHTFNAVASGGGQIILTCDKPPSAIKKLEDRLRSRFSGGLIVDIQPPDFELRCAILLIKAAEKKMEFDIEAARVVAEQITDSRALEGTLLSLYAQTLGNGEMINLETVEKYFETNKKAAVSKIVPADVVRAVCSYYNIRPSHLKGSVRSEALALPRQVAMFILRRELKLKFEEIAYLLKKKDHTTIMHGSEKITALIARDPVFKGEIDRIINSLNLSPSLPQ